MAKALARPRYGRRRERAPRRSGGGAGGDRWRWLSRTISLVDLDFRFARSGRKGKPPGRQRARGKQCGETATGEHGSTPSPSRPLRREGARSCAHLEFVQATAGWVPGQPPRAGYATGRILGRLQASLSLSLLAFALRDRGQISVAIDGLFTHVFPAAEQEYSKRDRDHCAQYGAKCPIPCLVVAHHQLRSFRLGQRPCRIEVPARMSACGTAATLWRMVEAFN